MQQTNTTYLEHPTPDLIAQTLRTWRTPDGQRAGLLAFVCDTVEDRAAVATLQRAATAEGLSLGGAIVPGLVLPSGFSRTGMLLLACDAASPHAIVPLPSVEGHTTAEATERLIDFVSTASNPAGGDTLLLILDVSIPDAATLIDALYLEIGDQVSYSGLCVGSETFQLLPCVFDNHQFIADAALAVILRQHPGAILAHHYSGNEALWVATATQGGHIETIDGRPAFDVYQELMTSEYGVTLNRDNFYQYAVHFPFALTRAHGEPLVRIPAKLEDDGSVYCSGEIRENSLLSVVRAIAPGDVSAAQEVGRGVGASGTENVLLFYCAGRFLHLGEDAAAIEVAAIREAAGSPAIYGAMCLGEIGSLKHQYPAFHNCTLTAMPWI